MNDVTIIRFWCRRGSGTVATMKVSTRSLTLLFTPTLLSLLGCAGGRDLDEGDAAGDPGATSPARPAPDRAPDDPRPREPADGDVDPTVDDPALPDGSAGGDPGGEPTCPAGTTYDGVGCGRWSPIATSCVDLEEPLPDGIAFRSRCRIVPPFGGTFDATLWVDPRAALVDLADGSQLLVREAPGVDMDSTVKAETWVHAPGGTWTRVGDTTSIERPTEAVVLADGRVLAVGCAVRHRCSHAVAEIFDPAAGAWVGAFMSPEIWPGNDTLFALPDGDALFIDGGRTARLHVAERAWEMGPASEMGMDEPAVELMPDGRALVVGGSLYGMERHAYLLDVETLVPRRTGDPGLYTFQNLAARAAGGVVVFGSAIEGDARAKVYTSGPP
jgi:hypothetical protein